MKFGSWTHDESRLDMRILTNASSDDIYTEHGEWQLLSIEQKRYDENALRRHLQVAAVNKVYDLTFSVKHYTTVSPSFKIKRGINK